MIIIPKEEAPQGSPEWLALRDRPSASNASKILTSTGKLSAQRDKYLNTLAGQRVSGRIETGFKSASMIEGNEKEADSRLHYELMNNVTITEVSCVFPDENRRYLCSPDGLIMDQETGFETKNACFDVQINRLKKRRPDPEHWAQMQMGMLTTGWSKWIYQSYCEGLPTLTLTIERDPKYCAALKAELDKFCEWLKGL